MGFVYLVLIFILAVSSFLHFQSQNVVLDQCQTRQDKLRERFQTLMQICASERSSHEKELFEKQQTRNFNTIEFLAQVLKSKSSEGDHDCSRKLNECRETVRLSNITAVKQTEALNQAIKRSNQELQSLKTENEQLRANLAAMQADLAEVTGRAADTLKLRRERDRLMSENEKLVSEMGKLRISLSSKSRTAATTSATIMDDDSVEMILDEFRPQTPASKRTTAVSNCDQDTFDFNTKRSSTPVLRKTSASSANRCKRMCSSDEECKSWTFVSDTGECLLHADMGLTMSSNCCTSGVICRN